jgi:beta-lactam-binding protein with PASTA domain/transcriptional regulator with XRE-family HTH domain
MIEQNKLGTILRTARENKGVTLAKAESSTRIRRKYLQALEEGRADDLPEPVFAKGFLRNYATYLGLDPQDVLELYYQDYGVERDVADVQPEIEPIRAPSRLTPALLTAALALVVFLLVMYYLYEQYTAPPLAPTPTIILDIPTPTPTPETTPAATIVPTAVQQDVTVPDIAGLTLQEADDALTKVGLRVEVIDRQFSESAKAGIILSQTVKAQTKVRTGSVVGATLSRGSQTVAVPHLVGLTYNDAVARLTALGLKVQRNDVSAQGAPNTVVGQDPVENAQVPPDTVVKVTVSVGDVVTVPDVRGMTQEEGKDALLKAGLVIGQIAFQGKDKVPMSDLLKVCVGCVLSTDPPAGRIVPRGAVINMGVRSE